jgi:uncharacterized protein YcbK (DUF882 family)
MGDLSKHFDTVEFECPHCRKVVTDPRLISGLQRLRDMAGVPIFVTSSYRCSEHNRAIKGATRSYHLSGQAADIVIAGLNVLEMYRLAVQIPEFENGGVGLYDGEFIHVDVRDTKARWGRIDGKYVKLLEFISWYAQEKKEAKDAENRT